ncbi:DUF3419 family protein [Sagittula salina]|uniref:BtaA family protein n=1 Tax=Sagittula salina TaxID=2820268 RepID=A0A940MQ52_9RHOB|nr:BtaA family protein [Sagittula salina]MBP0482716.1 BtaA family protein [Sagittula salina]
MTDTSPTLPRDTAALIAEAVHGNAPRASLGDRMFASLFRGLVYPQIWEDPVCDMAALGLSEADDVLCIASGGCNMMSYLCARPASLTAVDLSPWHVELGRLKLAAVRHLPDHAAFYSLFGDADRAANVDLLEQYVLPHLPPEARGFWNARQGLRRRKSLFARGFYRFGALGAFLGAVHVITRMGGVRWDDLLRAPTPEAQRAVFDAQIAPLFETRLVRGLAAQRGALFGLGIPPAQYDKLAADAGGDILPVLRDRCRKLFCDFPVSDNYFAWQAARRAYAPDGAGPVPPYLEPRHLGTLRAMAPRARVLHRSVTEHLSDAPAGSHSVYILLDAQDWMNDAQLTVLWQQITRTARPGARVLFRTGGTADILPGRVPDAILGQWRYDAPASRRAFETDRSAIYGGVHLYRKR